MSSASAVSYRRAAVEDAPALAVMNWQLIRDEGHRNPMSVAELEARMCAWLSNEYEAMILEVAGQVAGYALYRRDPDYVYLRQFFINPQFRREGIGRAAIHWLSEHAWNRQRVRVDVLVNNSAGVAFWRAVGFTDYCLTLELETSEAD